MPQMNDWQRSIFPAKVYRVPRDLGVVTSYFNSNGYLTKGANYQVFIESLEGSGIDYRVIECAFADQPFALPDSPRVMKVKSQAVLWQKERLLNKAIASLPSNCTKVAWLDCDVLFENELWALETSRLLDNYAVVQPFETAIRLPKGQRHYSGTGECYQSFAAVRHANPDRPPAGDFMTHGHTGFAWAARRDLLSRHGLYDACISGSADHMMSHAFCGDLASACNGQLFGSNELFLEHFREWARFVHDDISGKIGVVSGNLLHLWHGDTVNRQYLKHNMELARLHFNPYTDIRINSEGCWEWSSKGLSKPGLQEWATEFYISRKEDG